MAKYFIDSKNDEYCENGENTKMLVEGLSMSLRELDRRVQEVAVIGLPHPEWVEAVTAVAVIVDSLPKTPTGKILKRVMRLTYKDMCGGS